MYTIRTAIVLISILMLGCDQDINEPSEIALTIEIQRESSIKNISDCYDELINRIGKNYEGSQCNICGSYSAKPGEKIRIYGVLFSNGIVTSKDDTDYDISWIIDDEATYTSGADPREILLTLPESFDKITVDILNEYNGLSCRERLTIRNANHDIQLLDPGQAGLVIYNKGSFTQNWQYMEMSEVFLWSKYVAPTPGTFETKLDQAWGVETEFIGASGMGIGEGRSNTIDILRNIFKESESEVDDTFKTYSVWTVHNESRNGFSDWHLPSVMEARQYVEVFGSQGEDNSRGTLIWTSSEVDFQHAYAMNIFTGETIIKNKNERLRVYGVRYF